MKQNNQPYSTLHLLCNLKITNWHLNLSLHVCKVEHSYQPVNIAHYSGNQRWTHDHQLFRKTTNALVTSLLLRRTWKQLTSPSPSSGPSPSPFFQCPGLTTPLSNQFSKVVSSLIPCQDFTCLSRRITCRDFSKDFSKVLVKQWGEKWLVLQDPAQLNR